MSKEYLSRDSTWKIIEAVSDGELPYEKAISKLFRLVREAHGQVGVDGTYARFTPERYSFLEYLSKSSSIIKMAEGSTSSRNPVVEKEFEMLTEFHVIGNLVRRINCALSAVEALERTIYLSRMLSLESISTVKNRYRLHNNSLYDIVSKCNLLIRNEFSLYSLEEIQRMKREINRIKLLVK